MTTAPHPHQGVWRRLVVGFVGAAALASPACSLEHPSVTLQQAQPGPADNGRQARANELCEAVGLPFASNLGKVNSLERAHPSSVQAFIAWEERPKGSDGPRVESPYRGLPPNDFVALCYFDGEFTGAIPAGPLGTGPTGYTRLGVSVTEDREPRLYVAGRPETLPADDVPAESTT